MRRCAQATILNVVRMNQNERYLAAKQVTIVGAIVNCLLGVIKSFGGLLFNSQALLADGIHSFADLFSDAMVLIASKYGSQEADKAHPYGHQRIETAATLLLSLFLILAGAGIAWDAIYEVIFEQSDAPGWLALLIALVSIGANEILFHYTKHVGERIQSELIIANAWHHRSDALSSIVVAIGLLASMAGFYYCDAIAAIIVAAFIIKMGWRYGWNSVRELIDTAVAPEIVSRIERAIQEVPGVIKLHQLRTRTMGSDIYIDVHIQVEPKISVSEGHFIAQHVSFAIYNKIDDVKDITVHVDPEDDEVVQPSFKLPDRQTIDKLFMNTWRKSYPAFRHATIHYLDGALEIEVAFSEKVPLSLQADIDEVMQANKSIRSISPALYLTQ